MQYSAELDLSQPFCYVAHLVFTVAVMSNVSILFKSRLHIRVTLRSTFLSNLHEILHFHTCYFLSGQSYSYGITKKGGSNGTPLSPIDLHFKLVSFDSRYFSKFTSFTNTNKNASISTDTTASSLIEDIHCIEVQFQLNSHSIWLPCSSTSS